MKSAGAIVDLMRRGEAAPGRHFNPYLQEALELAGIVFTASELREQFPAIFADSPKPCVLEIGCYMGKTVIDLARLNPHLNILGIDLTYKRTAKAGRKIKAAGLRNACVGIANARDFLQHVPDGALSGVCIFFPDPWPKKGHAKNRLLAAPFLALLRQKLAPGGFFWLKTDSESYLADILDAAREAGWHVSSERTAPQLLTPDGYETAFESLFHSKQVPTFSRIFKPGPAS